MDLIPKYTRITNYNKLVDRFITAQVRRPQDQEKNKMGTVFALVEILNPWHPNAQIGQTIINTFVREYYKQANINEIINFENALKKVNEKLVQITQNGETDWIGKTNAIIAVVCNNHLHLSYSGKIRAYLLRDELMPIINAQENYSYHHPLKTFSAVVSGDLKISDKIFFSTNMLFDHLDDKKLSQILSDGDLGQVSMQIANILKSRNVKQVNSILIQTSTVKDEQPSSEVIYLDEGKFNFSLKSMAPSANNFKKSFSSIFNRIGSEFKKSQSFYQEQVAPQSKKLLEKTGNLTNKYFSKIKEKTISNQKPSTQATPQKASATVSHTSTPSLNIKHYKSAKEKSSLYFKKATDWIKVRSRNIGKYLSHAFSPKNRSKTYIIIAFILLAIFIANISYLQKINKNKVTLTQAETTLSELETKKDDASLAILTKDTQKAEKILSEINSQLDQFNNFPELTDRVNTLKNDVKTNIDKLSKTTRLTNGKQLVSFPQANQFYNIENNFYGIDYSSKIYQIATNSTQSPKEIAKLPSSEGTIKTSGQNNENIIVLTSQKNLYRLNNNNLNKISNDQGSWANAVSIKSYFDNLYLLDGVAGQIYKYTANDNGYGNASDYLDPAEIDIKNSVDFIVDGNIYVLKKDGNIVKLSQGQTVDFAIKNIPEPTSTLSNPKKIYTEENLSSLYILDNNRIIELDKNGVFIAQYAFDDNVTNITDFSINTKTKELYILNDNKIYKYNY